MLVAQLEDYLVNNEIALTSSELESLRQECALHSSDSLALFPGFTITTNIGNKMMVYGPDAKLPTAAEGVLTPDLKQFMIQPIDPAHPANFTGKKGKANDWCLAAPQADHKCIPAAPNKMTGWSLGYYHLGETRPAGSNR